MDTEYLKNVKSLFKYYKYLGEGTLAQLDDQDIHWEPRAESNSIAVIVKHMVGNMLSRWTNFPHEDGEKSWRNREDEFVDSITNLQDLNDLWEKGWDCLFSALDPLHPEDLQKITYIRNEGHTILEAINRQMTHYSYHVGQMVYLGKCIKAADWKSLSIPRGGSEAFNMEKFQAEKNKKNFV